MKQSLKRLTALILALSMALSLLCTSAWAAEIDPADAADTSVAEAVVEEIPEEEIPEEPAEEVVEPETPEEPVEEVVEPEAAEEESAEESEETEAATAEPEETETLNTAASVTCGENLTWTLDDAGTLTISGIGPMTDDPWRSSYDEDITSVIIENGVTSICESAFSYCQNLTSVTIPFGITSIGDWAFNSCTSLTSVTIPDSVDSIGEYAFDDCDNLTSAIIGAKSISYGAFFGCKKLSSVTISDGVTYIDRAAFFGCESLTGITIPDSVIIIGKHAFGYISDNETYEDVTFDGFSITGYTDSAAEKYAKNNGFAFVSIGTSSHPIDNVTLASGTCGENLNWVLKGSGTLTISGTGTMEDYDGYEDIPWYSNQDDISSVVIENGVTTIGASAFYRCNSLTSISIPNSITSIGNRAFMYCENLVSVTIPDSIISIGDYAFLTFFDFDSPDNVKFLTNVTIPSSVTSIGKYAFGYKSMVASYVPIEGYIIYGYTGSAAETYAKDNGISFVALDSKKSNSITASNVTKNASTKAQSFSLGAKAEGGTLTYKSSTSKVTVNKDGMVTIAANYVGTATITITAGDSNYETATKSVKVTVSKIANTITASNFTKTYSTKKQTFSIGAKRKGSGKITYTSSSKKVTVNKTTGKVAIPAKFIGTATITIKVAAKGIYKDATKKITVTVQPTKTTLSSVKNSASKKMTVKWKKNTVGTGYQIQYSTSSTFAKGNKTATITKKATTSKTISGLTKGKTYYVRIRTYKTVSGKKVYSAWSSKKSVKIKK